MNECKFLKHFRTAKKFPSLALLPNESYAQIGARTTNLLIHPITIYLRSKFGNDVWIDSISSHTTETLARYFRIYGSSRARRFAQLKNNITPAPAPETFCFIISFYLALVSHRVRWQARILCKYYIIISFAVSCSA